VRVFSSSTTTTTSADSKPLQTDAAAAKFNLEDEIEK
jgi:hypothetical protein